MLPIFRVLAVILDDQYDNLKTQANISMKSIPC